MRFMWLPQWSSIDPKAGVWAEDPNFILLYTSVCTKWCCFYTSVLTVQNQRRPPPQPPVEEETCQQLMKWNPPPFKESDRREKWVSPDRRHFNAAKWIILTCFWLTAKINSRHSSWWRGRMLAEVAAELHDGGRGGDRGGKNGVRFGGQWASSHFYEVSVKWCEIRNKNVVLPHRWEFSWYLKTTNVL